MAGPLTDLQRLSILPRDLQVAEYCFNCPTDWTKSPKTDPTVQHSKTLVAALGNSAGGVITHTFTDKKIDGAALDRWILAYEDQLETFVDEDTLDQCVKLVPEGHPPDRVHVLVRRFPEFRPLRYGLYHKGEARTRAVKSNKKTRDILNTVTKPKTRIVPESLKYGDTLNVMESRDIEFKAAESNLKRALKHERTQRCMFAMPNLPGGGVILFGIDNSGKIVGQKLSEADESTITAVVEKILTEDDENEEPRVWGTANNGHGPYWQIHYIPVENCPDRRRVVWLEFQHCPGGVFKNKPLAYQINEGGEVHELNTGDFKTQLQSSRRVSAATPSFPSSTGKTPAATILESATSVAAAATSTAAATPTATSATINAASPPSSSSSIPGMKKIDSLMPAQQDAALATASKISFTENSPGWRENMKLGEAEVKSVGSDLPMTRPLTFIPEESTIIGQANAKLVEKCLEEIKQTHSDQHGVVITCKEWLTNLPSRATPITVPRHHQMDLVSFDDSGKICLWVIWSGDAAGQDEYCRELGRRIKFLWMTQGRRDVQTLSSLHIEVHGWYSTGSRTSPFDLHKACQSYLLTPEDECHLLNTHLCRLLRQKTTFVTQRLGERELIKLTESQADLILKCGSHRFNFIEGPPGSGKTIMALHVCETFGKDKTCVLTGNKCLQKYWQYQGVSKCRLIASSEDMRHVLDKDLEDVSCLVVDDGHKVKASNSMWFSVFHKIKEKRKLYVFTDNREQNFECNLIGNAPQPTIAEEFRAYIKTTSGVSSYFETQLTEIHRNTLKVGAFVTGSMEGDDYTICHGKIGDDVEMITTDNLRSSENDNGIINIFRNLTETNYLIAGVETHYECQEIALIVDSSDMESDIAFYMDLLESRLPGAKPQRADVFPVRGVTVTSAEDFSGLEARVVVFVMPDGTEHSRLPTNSKFRCFVASRGICRVMFVTGSKLDKSAVDIMKPDLLPERSPPDYQAAVPSCEFAVPSGEAWGLWYLTICPLTDRVLVTDTHHNCVRVYTSVLDPVSRIGSKGTGRDEYIGVRGITVNTKGQVYVCDCENNRIKVVSLKGDYKSQIAPVERPEGLSVDRANGHLYVCEGPRDNRRILVLTTEGVHVREIPRSHFSSDPCRVCFCPVEGRLMVSDTDGNLYCVTPEGARLWTIPKGDGRVSFARGVTSDGQGHVLVADWVRSRVVVLAADSGELVTVFNSHRVEDVALTASGDVVTCDVSGLKLYKVPVK